MQLTQIRQLLDTPKALPRTWLSDSIASSSPYVTGDPLLIYALTTSAPTVGANSLGPPTTMIRSLL